jgi:hypothetical protein
MNKSLSTLLIAGMVAVGGVAHAETFDSPQQAGEASTMTMGAPNQLTTNSPYSDGQTVWIESSPHVIVDTTVLGASPAVVGSSIGAPDADVTYVFRPDVASRNQAAATFDVPSRAGEASTMTGGAPNMVTDNDRVILQNGYPVLVY